MLHKLGPELHSFTLILYTYMMQYRVCCVQLTLLLMNHCAVHTAGWRNFLLLDPM